MNRLPDFLIIGTARGGTTALWNYLRQHPAIHSPAKKEISYFSFHYDESLAWYKIHFPADNRFSEAQRWFEASPEYLIDVRIPGNVHAAMPGCEFIALLRNPVDRFWSQWIHRKKMFQTGNKYGIDDLIELIKSTDEKTPVIPEVRKGCYYPPRILQFGMYYHALLRWFEWFPRNQFLIIKSEDMFEDPDYVCRTCHRFLRVHPFTHGNYKQVDWIKARDGITDYPPIPDKLKTALVEFYRPFNEKLEILLNRKFDWD